MAALLRALWGVSGSSEREPSVDEDSPFRWETSRGAAPTPRGHEALDSPTDLLGLDGGTKEAAGVGSERPMVEIRDPALEPVRFRAPRAGGSAAAPGRIPSTVLKLSQRIVMHLYRTGTFERSEVAPPAATQQGMTESLGVRQSSLTKVLIRLVAAGVLEEFRAHVRGAPRRLKVYRLTPLGESLARDLRRSGTGAPFSSDPPFELPPARPPRS